MTKAFEFYKKSAENGISQAQLALGCCYKFGKGTEKNLIESVHWYLKTYDNRDTFAENALKELIKNNQ